MVFAHRGILDSLDSWDRDNWYKQEEVVDDGRMEFYDVVLLPYNFFFISWVPLTYQGRNHLSCSFLLNVSWIYFWQQDKHEKLMLCFCWVEIHRDWWEIWPWVSFQKISHNMALALSNQVCLLVWFHAVNWNASLLYFWLTLLSSILLGC